jgi:regulator of replication initiation timing
VKKAELEDRVAELEEQNDILFCEVSKDAGAISELEDENERLERELEELRGYVPPFPDEVYVTHPAEYIKQFNQLRHLKEITQ